MKVLIQIFIFIFFCFSPAIAQITFTNDGAAITIENGVTVTIGGSFVNQTNGTDGSIDNDGVITTSVSWTNNAGNNVFSTNTGRVEFINTTNNDTIKGTNPTHFHDLTLNNSTGSLEPFFIDVNNTTVRGDLTMTAGNVNLNNNKLILGTSAAATGGLIHSETSASGVLFGGSFERYIASGILASGDLKGFYPMGTSFAKYRPFYLSAAASGPGTGGSYTIYHSEAPDHTPTTPVTVADDVNIEMRQNASWTGVAAGIIGGTYELNAGGTGYGTITNVNHLRLMLASSVVGTAGVNSGVPANFRVQRTALSLANLNNTFFIGTVDSTNSPLPVQLLEFSVQLDVFGQAIISWSTASEINNDFFVLERSYDGINFEYILEENGAGTSYFQNNYSGIDGSFQKDKKIYYRLKQVDFDGSYSYSQIEVFQEENTKKVSVFPVPAFNKSVHVLYNLNATNSDKVNILLLNNLGQILMENSMTSHYIIPEHLFPSSGIYFVKIIEGSQESVSEILFYK